MQHTEYIGKLLFAKVAGAISEDDFKAEFTKTAAQNPNSWNNFWNGLGMKGTTFAPGAKGAWAQNMATAWNGTKGFWNKANLIGKVGMHWAKRNPFGAVIAGTAGLWAGNRLLNGGPQGYGYR